MEHGDFRGREALEVFFYAVIFLKEKSLLFVDFSTVADDSNSQRLGLVIDGVDHPVITETPAEQPTLLTGECFVTQHRCILSYPDHLLEDTHRSRFVDLSQIGFGVRCNDHLVGFGIRHRGPALVPRLTSAGPAASRAGKCAAA